MEAQDPVQPVEQPAELDDVLRLDRVVVEVAEKPAQPADLVLDLGVGAAERGGRVPAPERPGDERDEQRLVGALVREELALEPFEQGVRRDEVAVSVESASATPRICSTTASIASCSAFSACAVATSAGGIAMVCDRPGRTARSAMPIARTSMTSWSTAPAAGGR